MTYIQERGSTHVYHVNRMSKEEMDHMISLCVHDQPAYCVAACPFKVDTKEMLFYAAKGNFKKALAIYEKITPFPMILCDGCTAPCEEKCKLCEIGDGVSIREVERAIVRYGESGKRTGGSPGQQRSRKSLTGPTLSENEDNRERFGGPNGRNIRRYDEIRFEMDAARGSGNPAVCTAVRGADVRKAQRAVRIGRGDQSGRRVPAESPFHFPVRVRLLAVEIHRA